MSALIAALLERRASAFRRLPGLDAADTFDPDQLIGPDDILPVGGGQE
jgi:hypothetical protein